MSTPSAAFPFSPHPQSPSFGSDAPPSPVVPAPEERRRSKRESTASATRRREEAAQRYPSPPPVGGTRSRPTSVDASLVIPPYNPNNRRVASGGASPSPSPSASSSTSSRRDSRGFEERVNGLTQAPPAQYQQQGYNNRPASAMIVPVASPIPSHVSQSSSSRSRQSVGYLPTQPTVSSAGPYPQLYTPHQMPRQKIYFGPYILLQTLGEGEFGKVKLGVHSERWGEDVAIKLIKRGNVDTAQRGEKVRREIEVLKAVRHPNIVRLYDVIETEKYIGIVIEYASGGELFDHILAHRYLKERDASRLFAQLISGVSYLHAKGVVHRDLKLENLLLDRNRNCIITDFGFANRFTDAQTDLMATSCGSPCYAAPELVVQEGKYIGTAVDVWSCGVILYAMLAGYLPYDDDPANPEGDNINLLYKYIINTPLVFPDWITPEPRDLLLRMLVPDPAHRCTIEDVTRHSWLRKFAPAFTKSVEELEQQAQDQEIFKRQALEAQRQWLIQQQQQRSMQQQMPGGAAGGAMGMTRSQTTMGGMGGLTGPPSASTRHRSAMVTSTSTPQGMGIDMQPHQSQHLPASVPEEVPPAIPRPITIAPIPSSSHPNRRSGAFVPTSPTTTETHRISVDADPFSFEPRAASPPTSVPMQPSYSAPPDPPAVHEDQTMFDAAPSTATRSSTPTMATVMETPAAGTRSRRSSVKPLPAAPSTQSAEEAERERRKKANRATVQVEYDGGAQRRAKAPEPIVAPSAVNEPVVKEAEDIVMTPVEPEFPVDVVEPVATADPSSNLPPSVPYIRPVSENEPMRSSTPPLIPIPFPSTPPEVASLPSPAVISTPNNSTPKKRKSSGSPNSDRTAAADEAPPQAPTHSAVDATPKVKKASATPSDVSAASSQQARPPSVASNVSRHKHGASADRFSLRSLLGGSTTSLERPGGAKSSSEQEKEQMALDEVTNRRKSRRQKALSLQPFRHSTSSKVPKSASKAELPPPAPSSKSSSRVRSSTVTTANAAGSMAPPPRPSSVAQRPNTRASVASSPALPPPNMRQNSADLEANWSSSQAGSTPSGKAKAVMDWFRRRSTRGYPSTGSSDSGSGAAAPITTDFDRGRRNSTLTAATVEAPASSNASMRSGSVTPLPPAPAATAETTPSVVVTAAALPSPTTPNLPSTIADEPRSTAGSSRSASGGASSQFSQKTSSTVATSIAPSSISTVAAPITTAPTAPSSTPFPAHKLRVHQGALDKQALTYRYPVEVLSEIKAALWHMGVDAVLEGDFKIKCVRKSKKKAFATGSTNSAHSSGLQASHGSTTSTRRDSAIAMSASPSVSLGLSPSPSMGFRSLFTRKGSGGTLATINPATGASNSPSVGSIYSASFSPEIDQSPLSPSISQFGAFAPGFGASQPLPVYGEGSTDQGDEVRFFVELTRVKHLEGLYCVDVKRMKGAAFSFRCVYKQLLGRLDLGAV